MTNVTGEDADALRDLGVEGSEILKTRKAHAAPAGVVAILPDTVDATRAQGWIVRAKSLVTNVFGRESDFYESLCLVKSPEQHRQFSNAVAILGGAAEEASRLVTRAGANLAQEPRTGGAQGASNVFLVHGHDHGVMHNVARFLEKLKLTPVVLHEQANRGQTIVEKFESNSVDVAAAVVLLTPDDIGAVQGDQPKLAPRARQNVVFEHGFFVGALGRRRVVALRCGDVEVPSDLSGVLYVDMSGDWKLELAKELKAAGLKVDMNAAV